MDWENIDPQQFEQICYLVLEANGFTQIEWFGKGGSDKGRDLVAKLHDEPLPGHKRYTKWIVQCKRLIKKQLQKSDISDFLNSCREHEPDNALLIVTNTLSANLKDWLNSIKKDYKFAIFLWEERDITRELTKHKEYISSNFPSYDNIPAEAREVIFYEQKRNEILVACNEFNEVEFLVSNSDTYEDAIKKVKYFVDFIRSHKLTF